jgi:hypothetical protein
MPKPAIAAEIVRGWVYLGANCCRKMLDETMPPAFEKKFMTDARNAFEFSLVVLFCTKLGCQPSPVVGLAEGDLGGTPTMPGP